MGKIVLLDDLTINQIAAGEVIERPASVVKELVENSIDAGAKNITVEIKNGGISYIRITDDGSGIMPDDMEIAFERHATSKIRKADDLDTVKSMGFRGEALASIAAIAKVELVSRTEQNEIGYKIEIQGGDIIDEHEEGCPKGTTITVKELFYNTPVRYKFLKKDFTESGYIEDTITRIALANPSVAIKLVNTGKVAIQTTGSGRLEDVIYSIYGKEIAQNILPVDYEYEDMKVTGVIGKPAIARSNRTNQLFFVNKRFVKDKTLTSAAEQAFKGLVTIGKHAFLVLNIDMDPKKVDVNVHPTKLEVRFQEEGKVFKAIYNSIKQALLKYDLVPSSDKDYKNTTPNDILKNINANSNLFTTKVEAESEFDGIKAAANKVNTDEKAATNIANVNEKAAVNIANIEGKDEKISQNKDALVNNVETDNSNQESTIPKFSEFKSTMSGLDKETRRKFIDELTQTKSPEEIGVKLADMTKSLANKRDELIDDYEKNSHITEKDLQKEIEETEKEADLKADNNVTHNVGLEDTSEENFSKSASNEVDYSIDNKLGSGTDNKINDNSSEYIAENIEDKNANESTTENKKDDEETFEEMYKRLFGRDISEAKKEYTEKQAKEEEKYPISPITGEEISMFEKEGIDNNPQYKFIGIAFKTYIILTMGDDLYILDQHAAHERIMYEKVKANYYSDGEKDCQLMLLPDIIKLSTREMGIFRDNKEMFNKAGFAVEEFGDNTVKLTGVPEFCLDFDTQELFLETLDEINTVARTAKQEIEDKFLATVACKAAVKAHMALSKEEVDSLMDQLLRLPNPFTCPHGRPTVIKMSKTDIEKKFSRR